MIVLTIGKGKKIAINSSDIQYIAENETDTTVETNKDVFYVKEKYAEIVGQINPKPFPFKIALVSMLVGFAIALVVVLSMLDNPAILN